MTARFSVKLNEWEVFKDGEVFCHVRENDWDFFVANFKVEIHLL